MAIYELCARYANSIDMRDWTMFRTVFTPDCTYTIENMGRLDRTFVGLDALTEFMSSDAPHPVGHHVSNFQILTHEAPVTMYSKIIAPNHDGTSGSGEYFDELVSSTDGWKIHRRTVRLRRPIVGGNAR